ncbi:MAG TPA: hypothetical protein VMV92_39215 [Streptosporangiaceae bacterium]|nr:hypothetical protein [Streptosporangiaceae bacterium]
MGIRPSLFVTSGGLGKNASEKTIERQAKKDAEKRATGKDGGWVAPAAARAAETGR